ncbi:MAG: rod shape-determining protein MreC [Spirochaetes bacterium]|nr:MAG: rod shape-determining protein MreC [Spirochaetota bacterium]
MPSKKRGFSSLTPHGVPILLLAASVFLVSLSTGTILSLPERIGSSVVGAVQYLFSNIGGFARRTVFAIRELSDLRDQYETLAKKVESFQIMERDYADMRAENERLKEQLGFANNIRSILASAHIIAKDPNFVYSSLIIDKGDGDGVVKDLAVTAFQKGTEGLVGKVLSTWEASSIVLPLYDQRFFVSARLSRTRTEGLVNGKGDARNVLEMRYVSKLNAAEVQVGDLVVTSGLDSIYPPDVAIGRVKEISFPEYSSSALILLEPVLDFSRLEYLFVVGTASRQEQGQP